MGARKPIFLFDCNTGNVGLLLPFINEWLLLSFFKNQTPYFLLMKQQIKKTQLRVFKIIIPKVLTKTKLIKLPFLSLIHKDMQNKINC